MDIVAIILAIIVCGIPLYLWSYGASVLSVSGQRLRGYFWGGIVSGIFSVGTVYAITRFVPESQFGILVASILFLAVLLLGVIAISMFGSQIVARYIRTIGYIHSLCVVCIILLFGGIAFLFGSTLPLLISIIPMLLAVFFEEISKHMTTLGYLGQKFHFSLRDFAYFSFFVVTGFVFFENILYFFQGTGQSLVASIYRSIFPFSAHLLSAGICTLFWWKALSYPFVSLKYALYFISGLLLAIGVHLLYNISVAQGWFWLSVLVLFGAYILFVSMIHSEKYTHQS